MATLIYSDKCRHCFEIIEYIKTKPALHSVIQYQHVNEGVPPGVTKVPTMITTNGQMYVGKLIKDYLVSLTQEKIEKYGFSKMHAIKSGKYMPVSDINRDLRPIMTSELEHKISQSIEKGLENLKR